MITSDTIAACASAPGRSARAIMRVFGPGAALVFERLCGATPTGRGLRTVAVLLPPAPPFPSLAAWYDGGSSYNGDPGFELLLPGNPTLVERVTGALLACEGVRTANPGEFTARALLAGRLTLAQAEAVGALIAARSEDQLREARLAVSGALGAAFSRWTDELANLAALVEAGIDFTDQEDVVAIDAPSLRKRLAGLAAEIQSHLGAAVGAESVRDGVRVVLFGPPNAGKSTLFNALVGSSRSVASEVAGSTRDVIADDLAIPGLGAVVLADLPGLDDGASGPSVEAAQRAARGAIREADIGVWCDPSGEFREAGDRPLRTVRVRTFADQPGGAPGGLSVCALDGYGLPALRAAIADLAWEASAAAGVRAGVTPRQRRVMMALAEAVDQALGATGSTERLREPELVAESIRRALDRAGELVGRVGVEELLGRIFSTFCVGK
ncbi:MAG: tRNA modification GTPase [Phycisphaerales bacterium]